MAKLNATQRNTLKYTIGMLKSMAKGGKEDLMLATIAQMVVTMPINPAQVLRRFAPGPYKCELLQLADEVSARW